MIYHLYNAVEATTTHTDACTAAFRGVKLSSPGPSPKGEQTNTGKYAGLVRFVRSYIINQD